MDMDVLELVVDRRVGIRELIPATLPGYVRRRVIGEDFPVLVNAPHYEVAGAVFEPRGDDEFQRLLFYEGSDYRLQPCRPLLENGRRVPAEYFAGAPILARSGEVWDYEDWCRRTKESFLAYVRPLMNNFRAYADPDPYWRLTDPERDSTPGLD